MENSGNIPTFNIRGIFPRISQGTFSEYSRNISWECSTNIPRTYICLVGSIIIIIIVNNITFYETVICREIFFRQYFCKLYVSESFRKFTKKYQWRGLMLVTLQAFTGVEQPPDAFCKKVFLERCSQNSQEKACVKESILIKLHSKGCEKRTWQKCFPVNLAKFLRTPFLQNTSGRLLLLLAFQKQPPKVFYERRCSRKFRKILRKIPLV